MIFSMCQQDLFVVFLSIVERGEMRIVLFLIMFERHSGFTLEAEYAPTELLR